MSSGNQQLGFAIRAVNEANAALQDVRGDLDAMDKKARELDETMFDLNQTWGKADSGADELAASLDALSKNLDPAGVQPTADAFGQLERTLIGAKDIMGVLTDQFGISLGPMEEYAGAAADVAGGLEGVLGGGAALVKQFGPMLSSIPPVVAATWAHVAALTAQAAAFIVANAPILAIVAGVALLAAGVLLVIQNWDPIVDFFQKDVPAAFKAAKDEGFQMVMDFVKDHWPEIASLVLLPFAPIILLATDAFGIRSKAIEGFQAIIDFVTGLPAAAKEAALGLGTALKDGVVEGFGAIATSGLDMAEDLIAAVKAAWNAAIQFADDNFKLSLPGVSIKGHELIPGVEWDPDLSFAKLAAGGIVTKPTLALIGEGGEPEAVVPLSQLSGGAKGLAETHIHVHVAGSVFGVDNLIYTIDRALKRAGASGLVA